MERERISEAAFLDVLALADMRLAVQEHCQRWHGLDPDRTQDYATFMIDTGNALQRLYPVQDGHHESETIGTLPDTIRDVYEVLWDGGEDETTRNVWHKPLHPSIAAFRDAANEIRRRHFQDHDAKAILFGHTLHTALEQAAEASRRQGYIVAGLTFCAVANVFDPPVLISFGPAVMAYSLRLGWHSHRMLRMERELSHETWHKITEPHTPTVLEHRLAAAQNWSFGRIEEEFPITPLTATMMANLRHLDRYQQKNPCRSVFSIQPTPG